MCDRGVFEGKMLPFFAPSIPSQLASQPNLSDLARISSEQNRHELADVARACEVNMAAIS